MSLKLASGISMNPFSTPSDNFPENSPVPPRSSLLAIFIKSSKLIPDVRMSKVSCRAKGKRPVTLISVSSKFPSIFNSPAAIVQLSVESSSLTSSSVVSVSTILLSRSRLAVSVLFPLNAPVPASIPVLSARLSGSWANIDRKGMSRILVACHFPR